MIELWDTSALILAARDPRVAAGLGEALATDEVAISEPVLLEYLNGARSVAEYERFDETLRAARLLSTTPDDWQRALEVHRLLAGTGPGHQRTVRLVDLIVAAVAERHRYPLAHCDRDYERIAAISGQATRWVALPGHPLPETKLRAVREAATLAYPIADVDALPAEVERGYRPGDPPAADPADA